MKKAITSIFLGVSLIVRTVNAPVVYAQNVPTGAFLGEYYNNLDFTSLVTTRVDDEVNFNWEDRSPIAGVDHDTFSVRWRGNFFFDEREYEFRVISDDGVRVYLDGELIIDGWRLQNSGEYKVKKFVSGGAHQVKVEFYDNRQEARITVKWGEPTNGTNLGGTTPTQAVVDTDRDGLINDDERELGTDPQDEDSDDDGLLDGSEVNNYQTNPLKSDTDDDGLLDGSEVNTHDTDPLKPDTDGDRLTDGDEVNKHKTDPNDKDTDDDGLDDGTEVIDCHTNPLDKDTDDDGTNDKDDPDACGIPTPTPTETEDEPEVLATNSDQLPETGLLDFVHLWTIGFFGSVGGYLFRRFNLKRLSKSVSLDN